MMLMDRLPNIVKVLKKNPDVAYFDSKNLARRTMLDKILKIKPYEIAINPKYDGYQGGLASMVHKFFDEKIGSKTSANKSLLKDYRNQRLKNSKEGNCM